MYEEFFGLDKRPFNNIPNPDLYVDLESSKKSLDELFNCVMQSRGIGVLTAPAGLGKTILCKKLAELAASRFQTILLGTATFSNRLDLLQHILYEFGIEYEGLNEHEARLKIMDAARAISNEGRNLLIIVDEAHLLNSRLFEELRVLADYAPDGESLIQLVLSGQFELEEKLVHPSLSAFNQRVAVQTCLKLLSLEESITFIVERLRMCGVATPGDVLDESALETICRASDGNPRCLCQLTDHSLILAFAEELKPFQQATVLAALEDLKELPLHWNDVSSDTDSEPESTADATRETDLFRLPEQSSEEFTSAESDNQSLESELSDSLLDGEGDESIAETTEPSINFSETVEFSVLEVGAGIESSSETSPTAEQEEQPACELSAEQDEQSMMMEELIRDKYATLDGLQEREEIDLDHILDSEHYPHPVGYRHSLTSAKRSCVEQAEVGQEDEILISVQDLGHEIADVVQRSRRSRKSDANWHGDTWIELDVVQPSPLPSEFDSETINDVSPERVSSSVPERQPTAPQESSKVNPESGNYQPPPRFSRLFARLSERRRQLKNRQQHDV
ncbi:AAA family ATPase [Thalassoglobus sp. JC818]|uniref:ExeA family protein n=1 Tax=Thalassoglobus sp. JC818 TaxID=3232136 RepID=UPI003457CA9E